jgi:hypothetical protein
VARGGNSMGLTGSDLPRFVLEIAGIYNGSANDALAQQAGQAFTQAILQQLPGQIAASKKAGAPVEEYLPYFMNDAGPDQDVVHSYANVGEFKALQKAMDPHGFWTRTGGYHY